MRVKFVNARGRSSWSLEGGFLLWAGESPGVPIRGSMAGVRIPRCSGEDGKVRKSAPVGNIRHRSDDKACMPARLTHGLALSRVRTPYFSQARRMKFRFIALTWAR